MGESVTHDALIRALAADAPAVRPLRPPALRALAWLALAAAIGLGLAQVSDVAAMWARLSGAPDLGLAAAGAALTAILAAFAAFASSVPGRSRLWPLLPLPGLALWLGASGLGCLRAWGAPDASQINLFEERACLAFILGVSLPLSLAIGVMLRRAAPLRPGVTAVLGGLAAAAAAAALLNLFHPYDAAVSDLLVHTLAVGLVVGVNRLLAGRLSPMRGG